MKCAITSKDLSDKFNPFVKTLLSTDSRFRLCPFYGDIDENKGFFVTKEAIHFPYALPKIEHDIAHLLELKAPRRWTLPDWGMPRFEAERIAPCPFFAAFARETRTRAIQLHIEEFPNEKAKYKSTTWSQLNNEYWDDMVKKNIPFGRFKTYQDVVTWMCDLRERTFKAWSKDRIVHEWGIRINHISNWMETANA